MKSLIQSSILEGINFLSGFAYFYNMVRQNRMTGTGKIISFINRDELAHTKFISELIRAHHRREPGAADQRADRLCAPGVRARHRTGNPVSSEVLDGIDGIDVEEMTR